MTPDIASRARRRITIVENKMRISPNSMFLPEAAVVNTLNLDTDLFAQTAEHFAGSDAAGAMRGAAVLIRVETHGGGLLDGNYEGSSSRFQIMRWQERCARCSA